jgi:GTP 3',8-cyclase
VDERLVKSEKPSVVYWLDNNLYLNITNRCSNNCWFCFRNFKDGVGGFNLKLKTEPTLSDITRELEIGLSLRRWNEVVFCGFGEPTERLDVLLEVTRWIRNRSDGTITIRVNTNGHGYALNKGREVAREMKNAGVTRVSVSLNGYDEETYSSNCRPCFNGGFREVVKFVKEALEAKLEVEVSAVRMPEVDIDKVERITKSLGAKFRIRDYNPCFW